MESKEVHGRFTILTCHDEKHKKMAIEQASVQDNWRVVCGKFCDYCDDKVMEFLPKEKCCEQTYSTFCDNCDSRGEYCAKECTCPCHKKPEKKSLPFDIAENRRCKCDDIQMHDLCEKCPECEGVRKCRERDYYTRAEIDEKLVANKTCAKCGFFNTTVCPLDCHSH